MREVLERMREVLQGYRDRERVLVETVKRQRAQIDQMRAT